MKLNIEKGEILMKVRIQTLWKVPVFCMVASWISFSITVYLGGFFFGVKTVDADGVTIVSTDPVRSVIFHTVIFLIIVQLRPGGAAAEHPPERTFSVRGLCPVRQRCV